MKKNMYWKKAVTVTTAIVMGCAMTACSSVSSAEEKSPNNKEAEVESEELLETMNDVTGMNSAGTAGADKEETVYVMADAEGKPTEVIVSEWLKNAEHAKTLADQTNLTDIENVKGDEKYTETKDGIKWEADGADIYYQGKSEKELPVSVNVSYYLDDKKMRPEQMLGKSGKIKIRYDYVNNSTATAQVGGEDTDIYTPFVMATGMILPTDTFSNVIVSNGNVISEGNNMIAVGVAMPGLSESMGFDNLEELDFDLEIPDYFEVTADVQNFSLGMSLTLCSNNLVDMDKFFSNNSMDGITDKVDTLIDGAGQLKDGAGQLADGTSTLKSKLGEFAVGVKELQTGIKTYTDGVQSVYDGTSQLAGGAAQVDDGVQTVADGIASAKGGSAQLVEGAGKLAAGSNTLVAGVNEANEGASALASGATTAQSGVNQIVAGYEGERGAVAGAQQIAGGLDQLNQAVQGLNLPDMSTQSAKLTDEQRTAVEAQVIQYLSEGTGAAILAAKTDEFVNGVKAAMAQYGVSLDAATEAVLTQVMDGAFCQAFVQVYISAYESGMEMGMEQVLAQVSQQLEAYAPQIDTLKSSVAQLDEGANALAGGVNQLYEGTKSLRDGLNQLADGAVQLSEGTSQLYSGSKELSNGIGTLYTGSTALDSGLGQLNSGIGTLKSGTSTLRAGTFTLQKGVTTLNESSSKLVDGSDKVADATGQFQDGVGTLDAGAIELKNGVVKFNDEGIEKISNIINKDMNNITDRLEALSSVNNSYELYGGSLEGSKSVEKFIIKVDGIEK